ncbi:hypothetical protein ACKVWC_008198 [Pyricularia oryzae]
MVQPPHGMHAKTLATLVLVPCLAAKSLRQVLASHGSLTALHDMLIRLDLLADFEATKNSTLLAMTDAAFDYLTNWGMDLGAVDPEIARGVMKYHFFPGVYASGDARLKLDGGLIAHSILKPPFLTNVTRGAAAKLLGAGPRDPFRVESGIQKMLPVVQGDIAHDSGILHTLDENLVLPHSLSETTRLSQHLDGFWTLVQKAQLTGLLESLQDVTVLLPDNEAVDKVRGRLDSLNDRELKAVIANHVIPNRVLHLADFAAGDGVKAAALGGLHLDLKRDSEERLLVNDARVLKADLLVYGGVVHILDTVLLAEQGGLVVQT